ncbi:PR domain zinc finger protein 8 [Dissostichus eleginoides]|uniref:PR domain zinc finger protein 8 n=1 Tax=Dissostichus eleginoides TaxID=100907 RepID=A0AAD9F5D0_DISEL|nr:PR domain zinc finger protein 8 [Dissostichus eleginoides]
MFFLFIFKHLFAHLSTFFKKPFFSVFLNLSIPTSGFENPCVLGFIYKSIPFIMSMHYKSSIFCVLPLFLRVISSVITLSSNNSLIFLFLPVVFLWCYVRCSYAVCHLCGTPFMFVPIKHPMNH